MSAINIDPCDVIANPDDYTSAERQMAADAVRELVAFARSFRINVTDSYYLDAYLHITRPQKAITYRLQTPSTMSPDLAEIERMRTAALARIGGAA